VLVAFQTASGRSLADIGIVPSDDGTVTLTGLGCLLAGAVVIAREDA
jgi:hypothetical protein